MTPSFRVLYTDETEASREAEDALRDAHLSFSPATLSNPEQEGINPPHLLTAEGTFSGLKDILWSVRVYGPSGSTDAGGMR